MQTHRFVSKFHIRMYFLHTKNAPREVKPFVAQSLRNYKLCQIFFCRFTQLLFTSCLILCTCSTTEFHIRCRFDAKSSKKTIEYRCNKKMSTAKTELIFLLRMYFLTTQILFFFFCYASTRASSTTTFALG